MSRFRLAPALLALLLCGASASAQMNVRLHKVNYIYAIHYDDDVEVRSLVPPISAIRAAGGMPAAADLQGLRDRGLPGYRALRSDIGGAWYMTIYLERVIPGPGDKVRRVPLPPLLCMVHHNRLSQNSLVLYNQRYTIGNAPMPFLIGEGPLGNGIPLPNVRLKRIVIDSYYPYAYRLP